MGGLIQPTPTSVERDSSGRIIAITVAVVLGLAVIVALLLRTEPKSAAGPPPYAAKIKLADLKMSAAENFVGATVSYIDGTVTNSGDKIVTNVLLNVVFKDQLGQIVQSEKAPMKVLKTQGPYPEAVDLNTSPLAPAQTQPFRLTFESISAQWNHQYPEIQLTEVLTK